MKNKKLVKVLAAITMSAAAVGCMALFGCGSHKHTFSDTWKSDDPSGHWYEATCEHKDEKKDFAPHVYDNDEDTDCNVCGYVKPKSISYEFIPSNLKADTYADGLTTGIFTVLPGTTIRTRAREGYNVYDYKNGEGDSTSEPVATGFTASKSVQYNGSERGISVKAIAPGKLTIYIDNGSGGKTKTDKQTILLTKPDGTTQVISYYCGDMYAVTINCDTIGDYKITRGNEAGVGTTDLYYAKFEAENVRVTPVEKIQIANEGKVSYLRNTEFDYSELQVQIVRKETGMIEPLDLSDPAVKVDSSAFDKTKAGEYKITISYTEKGETFKVEYTVKVHAVEAIKLGFNAVAQGGNTTAGNGQYINHAVQQFYFKNDKLNLDGLSVKTVFDGGKQEVAVTEGFTVSEVDMTTAGKKEVTVTWNDDSSVVAKFYIYVANFTAADVELGTDMVGAHQVGKIITYVNGTIEDELVGACVEGVYQFKTIQQALDFLNALKLEENDKKIINLGEGTYKEKLEINLANVTIKGADIEDPTKTVIEWDSLYGIKDEGGFTHTTDSTATLNVREDAVGFVIEGVTVSNWYNSEAHFNEKFGAGYQEHRALAMLIQADKVVVDHCRLLGYQDTLELFTGRQLIQNTYICGRTDFIFGTNNTTYFKDCEIESIVSSGYVTAFKGCNKGDGDWVQYGAIFDGCNFTAPEDVVKAADTSLGRTWGKYAAVAYVNCNFAGHISTKAYGEGKGTRYTAMSGAEPTDGTVKFVEYNNTGAGAISAEKYAELVAPYKEALIKQLQDAGKTEEEIAKELEKLNVFGYKLLTEEEAANYVNMEVFFGKTNGKVTYSTTWNGSKGVFITEKTFKFTPENVAEAKLHGTEAEGEELFGGKMTVIAVDGAQWRAESSKNQAQFMDGCVIQFKEVGAVYVTTYGGNYGQDENVRIFYKDGIATVYIVATAGSPINNGCYITLIKMDMSITPADSEINYSFCDGIHGDGNVTGTVAEPAELADGDITLVGNIRNNNGDGYQVTNGAVLTFTKRGQIKINWHNYQSSDENASIFYTDGFAEITIIGNPYILSITLDTSVIPADSTVIFEEDKVVDLLDLSTVYEGNTGRYEGIEIDATNGKFANNNGGWIQMNTGTVLKVHVAEGIVVSVTEYQNKGLVSVSNRDENGLVTITATGDTYISEVLFTIEKLYDNDATVDLLGLAYSYEGTTGSYKGIKIDAANGKFAKNNDWIQMNAGTVLKVHVGEGIVVTVEELNDAGNVSVGTRDANGWVTITATGDTHIRKVIMQLPLVRITEDYTYTYVQGNRKDGTLEVGTDKIKFDNCKVNNSWLAYGTITMDVAKGATITIKGSQYDSNVYFNGSTTAAEHVVDGNYWMYTFTVAEADEGLITISGSAYLASITVTF